MNSYVALDLENPNSKGNSICELAMIEVMDGKVVNEWSSLINPEDYFDARNAQITKLNSTTVSGAPTLPECWAEIEPIIANKVILGHNISYDLAVLKKSLERYNLTMPEVSYCCTLALSRKWIQTDSYKLSNLCQNIGYKYDAHQAKADALAAIELFKFLSDKVTSDDIRSYNGNNPTQKRAKIDEHLISNLNTLNGLISGITADDIVDEEELKCLLNWASENQVNRVYTIFDEIIEIIESFTEDGVIDSYELQHLKSLASYINYSRIYNETTLSLQQLFGILEGIICDQIIADEEVKALSRWLSEHDYLSGVYPYDKLYVQIQDILADGIITDEEQDEMIKSFEEILYPIQEGHHDFDLHGKTFCLTGDFLYGSKAEIKAKLESFGAIEKTGVSAKLNYLFVGGEGSSAWKYGTSGGGKIKKAQEFQEKGCAIQIIPESDMNAIFDD